MVSKRKIINDPVYGFITFRHGLLLDLADHPWFQRLRRISQLGLSHLVYPGALHNRFQHAVGAMFLGQNAVEELRHKGHSITPSEEESLLAAILLHDIGHGPFSHALEHTIMSEVNHEHISLFMMRELNRQMHGRLDMAISIFEDTYPKHFLHQLVSSQLDMDRLDYLARDSFFSGVVEGQVGSERIIKMLDVANDHLVMEEKGIYSIEKFIVARRFMYWQVYLHKTVLSAEFMLVSTLKRAKWLAEHGKELFASPSLHFFLYNKITGHDITTKPEVMNYFAELDDFDITGAMKVWQSHEDRVLAMLSSDLIQRRLFKIELRKKSFEEAEIEKRKRDLEKQLNVSKEEVEYFVLHDKVDNRAYDSLNDSIRILKKDGSIIEAAEASEHLNLTAINSRDEKWFLASPLV
ncbi:MAG: HD domain-containing protein [Nitrospirota bacterium]|nr:HD domain-containing protein [Nitrospirota bacterium]